MPNAKIAILWAAVSAHPDALVDRPGPGVDPREHAWSRPDARPRNSSSCFLPRAILLAGVVGVLLAMASCGSGPADGDIGGPDARPPEPVTYFLVAEWPGEEMHGDSYVLPVNRAEDIEHARDLIALGPQAAGRAVAVAKVRLGADGINRNLRGAGQPAWSWHVTEFMGFSDGSVEILDGWPGWIEQDPEGWMQNTPPNGQTPDTEGSVGFWTYTVVEELPGAPGAAGLALDATARTRARHELPDT
jgi:hypothetical protein